MPRVMINGVIWCKAEDDILKKAVEKYGQEQWLLVASLLSGKTDKQCKARWDSAFNPNIKITGSKYTTRNDSSKSQIKKRNGMYR